MTTEPLNLDPFDSSTDADPEDREGIRARTWGRANERVGYGDGLAKKPKKADFNGHQRDWFRKAGWTFEKVEHPNTFGAVTVDLWGFADWLACAVGEGVLLIQTCRYSDISTRERKARSKPELPKWLAAGGRFQLHGWHQPKGPGTRWEVVIRELTPDGRKT